jgi:hypothetical protein
LGRPKTAFGDAHNIAVGVDTRSGAGLAHRLARSDRDNRREARPAPASQERPVRQPWLPLWRRPCGHIARRKGQQGQTARRRVRGHVVKPDSDQLPIWTAKDRVALGAAVVLRRRGKPCGKKVQPRPMCPDPSQSKGIRGNF